MPVTQSQLRGEHLEKAVAIFGLIPAAAWLLYFGFRPGSRQGEFQAVIRVFLLGCAVTIPGGLLEHLTGARISHSDVSYAVAVSFGLIAPIEEGLKLLVESV